MKASILIFLKKVFCPEELNLLAESEKETEWLELTVREKGDTRFYFLLNHDDQQHMINSPARGRDLLGEKDYKKGEGIELCAYGVAILEVKD